jgi:small subunit ribosomal protein S6
MALYEHVFLARQDLAQAQVDALAATATEIVTTNGGTVVKTENWGLRSLAYKIAKNRKAHYVMIEIDGPGPVVAELERQTQINEDIIRYMTIKVDAHEAGPSVMLRKSERSERSDRGDRGDRGDRPRRDREDRPRRDDEFTGVEV